MKKIVFLLVGIMTLTLTSCQDGIDDTTGFVRWYHYEREDTILSAASHEIELTNLSATHGIALPKDWRVGDFRVWHGTEFTQVNGHIHLEWQQVNIDIPGTERHPMNNYHYTDNTCGTEWIEFEKQSTETTPKIKINVKENDTKYVRAVKFMFYTRKKKDKFWPCGEIIIVQEPKYNPNPKLK